MKYKNITIKKRADRKLWWARYTRNGKQISIYGKTQIECLAKLKAAMNNKTKHYNKKTTITLKAWIEKWFMLFKQDNKETTNHRTKNILEKHVSFLFERDISTIKSLEINEILASITATRQKQHLYIALKDCFDKAVKSDIITKNPLSSIQKPKHTSEVSKALTNKEEEQFIKTALKYENSNVLLICLYQGLRIGEALALTSSDIDFSENTITINKAKNQKEELSTPKTASSKRTIPLFERTKKILPQIEGELFRMSHCTAEHLFKKICSQASLTGFRIHSLRHTFATRCQEKGIAPKTVQKWLGHSTSKITMEIYTHVNSDFENSQKKLMD